jgi:hypothetical protein
MWRRLLARLHPDAGGDGELFTFGQAVREQVTGDGRCDRCLAHSYSEYGSSTNASEAKERIDFNPPTGDPFEHLRMILGVAKDVPNPFRDVLLLLIDCPTEDHGRAFASQATGASYRQLAYLAHLAGFSDEERQRWYSLAEDLSLSGRHVSHLISTLKAAA